MFFAPTNHLQFSNLTRLTLYVKATYYSLSNQYHESMKNRARPLSANFVVQKNVEKSGYNPFGHAWQ